MKRKGFLLCLLVIILGGFGIFNFSAQPKEKVPVVFADPGWDSVRFHNAVAALIGEKLYGISSTVMSGSTPIVETALLRGDIDVHMEQWTDNIPTYQADLKTGKIEEIGTNYADDKQGFYVPRYLVEGDEKKGIKPLAPNLRTVKDLPKYAHLFKDSEHPTKGRLYGAIPGWTIDEIMYKKYEAYGLDEKYVYFRCGSEATLFTAFMAAYNKGEPIVGYCYEPTWVTGKLDLILLEDEPYNEEGFLQGLTEARAVPVCVVINKQMRQKSPEFVEFLTKYQTSSALTAEALSYIADNGATYEEAAKWFLLKHPELPLKWLSAEKAEQLNKVLRTGEAATVNNWVEFPESLRVDWTGYIDRFVKYINVTYANFFNGVKNILNWCIVSFEGLLNAIPYWLTIIATVFITQYLTGSWRKGILFAAGLFLIGMFGYWRLMNETLAVIFASVLISLLIGIPIGVLVSTWEWANKLLQPLLDAMQTMPTFVYMIPCVMLLGPGKIPAVLATVIYAVVPVIRLTSHGIRQVDKEVVEASNSFGASRWQTLFKVQIPLAMPTILTGVNQTIMMAIAMVVTCAMIGANGLGMEVLIAINRTESGRGLIAGISIVIIAIIIDRLARSLAQKQEGDE